MADYTYTEDDYIHGGASWDKLRAEGTDLTLSKFDAQLRAAWDALMDAGHFRYTLDHVRQRIISGSERFITQLNLKRGIERRVPEHIDSLNMPFNPDKFNFTKVKKDEIIFQLIPNQDPGMRGSNGQLGQAQTNGLNERDTNSNGQTRESRHILLINVSPLAYGHCLVVCDVDDQIHQKMTLTSHKMAIETILLSNHPGFRAGFNSLCALASVNHQHFHTWYMDEPLTVESAPTKELCHGLHEMIDKPTRALVLQLHGHTVDELAKMAFTITDFYQKNEIAHNVFLTKGPAIGDARDRVRTVRVYIWPRKNIIGIKSESGGTIFNVAVAELAGFVPMYSATEFDNTTEADIIRTIHGQLLPDEQFNQLRDQVVALVQSQQTRH